ncbi:MAG: type VI secretion system contractile sheath large subunit [Pirellulaceae bacterium]|nr:type VI secretion system contractile sheath large subunit [Pirellulaceae bacterium]
MAETNEQVSAEAQTTTTEAKKGFLEKAIKATKQTERTRAEDLLRNFTQQALQGTVTWDKSLARSIQNAIDAIDEKISKQLSAVMHHPDFQKLEGSWRGLGYLVMNSETGTDLKLRVLNTTKRDLQKDLENAVEFDQSTLYKKIYEQEFGTPGGIPYASLVGDFEFTKHPDDIQMLRNLSTVAAAAFCPFIASAGCEMFGFDDWTDMNVPRDIKKIFDSPEYNAWKSFRETEDSRFVTLTMPRTLARLPYGANTKPIDEFAYEEVELGRDGKPKTTNHDEYCWMSTAYVMGSRLTNAFAEYGWCTAIRGHEGGGKVENLPTHIVKAEDGDMEVKCPTEVLIPDRREKEISDCGFLPLCHYKETDYAVFFGGQTTQKPKLYEGKDGDAATENAAISARLPYIMATSRIAHYLKVIARDKIGSFMERDECEKWLNEWITNYKTDDPNPSQETKARKPLAAAEIKVTSVPGAPGSYNAVAYLRPWLQFEELTASLRLVTKIPSGNK